MDGAVPLGVAELTVKLTSKLSEILLSPLTVMVAVCVPAESPVSGVTVKVAPVAVAMLLIVSGATVKLLPPVPDRPMLSSPVG